MTRDQTENISRPCYSFHQYSLCVSNKHHTSSQHKHTYKLVEYSLWLYFRVPVDYSFILLEQNLALSYKHIVEVRTYFLADACFSFSFCIYFFFCIDLPLVSLFLFVVQMKPCVNVDTLNAYFIVFILEKKKKKLSPGHRAGLI